MTSEQEDAILTNMEAAIAPRAKWRKWRGPALIVAVIAGFYWYGDVILNYDGADDACLKFAEKTDINPASDPDPNDKKIFVAKKWIKNGYVVVELGQKTKKGYFQSRLCVLGGGQIQIPGIFGEWQYK